MHARSNCDEVKMTDALKQHRFRAILAQVGLPKQLFIPIHEIVCISTLLEYRCHGQELFALGFGHSECF